MQFFKCVYTVVKLTISALIFIFCRMEYGHNIGMELDYVDNSRGSDDSVEMAMAILTKQKFVVRNILCCRFF